MIDTLSLFWEFFFYPLQRFDIDNSLFSVLVLSLVVFAVFRVTFNLASFFSNDVRR